MAEAPGLAASAGGGTARNRNQGGTHEKPGNLWAGAFATDLAEHGVQAGVHRIKRIRKAHGIRCKQVKKFKATTNSNHSLPVAENLLEQNFAAEAPNQVWVTDITYIPTAEGWLYLAGHKDCYQWSNFFRQIYHLEKSPPKEKICR